MTEQKGRIQPYKVQPLTFPQTPEAREILNRVQEQGAETGRKIAEAAMQRAAETYREELAKGYDALLTDDRTQAESRATAQHILSTHRKAVRGVAIRFICIASLTSLVAIAISAPVLPGAITVLFVSLIGSMVSEFTR